MTLTEKWKKGELKVGECYFIRLKSGKIIPQMYSSICIDGHHCTDFALSYGNVEEVLAPVPSYEEWQELKEFADYSLQNRDELTRQINFWIDKNNQIEKENTQLHKFLEEFNALDVAKENQQLKELLKECKEFFYENLIDTEFHFSCGLGSDIKKQSCIKSLSKLKTKIDEVLK